MNPRLSDALHDCLARVEAGESPSEALAHHADLRSELAPLVEAAMSVGALPPKAPRPVFRARVQSELTRLEAEMGAPHHPETWLARLRAPLHPGATDQRVLVGRMVFVFAALLLALGSLVAVSANSRPGDTLYPVRRNVEHFLGRPAAGGPPDHPGASGEIATNAGESKDDASPLPLAMGSPTAVDRLPTRPPAEAPAFRQPAPTETDATPESIAVYVIVPGDDESGEPRSTGMPFVQPEPIAPTDPDDDPDSTNPPPFVQPVFEETRTATPGSMPTNDSSVSTPPPVDPEPTATQPPQPPATPTGENLTVHGTVKQADGASGRPLPGLTVTLYRDFSVPSCPPPDLGTFTVATSVTDSEGRYALQVPPGPYRLAVEGRTLADECFPVAWWVDGRGSLVEDACDQAGTMDLSAGTSPALPFNLVYAETVATTCP
jgi:hypothetical protein